MDGAHWTRLEKIIDEILDTPETERKLKIHQLCGDDETLYNELTTWIDAIESSGHFWEIKKRKIQEYVSKLIPEDADGLAGQNIGPYKLIRRLASGGMGVVYLAERSDDQFQREVAIKVMRPGLDTPEHIWRFRRERQLLANLTHAGIARLYDGGITDNGRQYFVMEYVEGECIDTYCKKHSLATNQIIRLFLDVCEAVQYAHSKLILHRDLKPENILVKSNGRVCILDFGISQLLENQPEPKNIDRTQSIFRFLSPEFAAPEQIQGTEETPATDIYALGTLLYVLLTGRHPLDLEQKTWKQVRQAILKHDPVRPSLIHAHSSQSNDDRPAVYQRHLTSDLDAILLKSISKEPAQRYASVKDLMEDLLRYQQNKTVQARRQTTYYKFSRFVKRHVTSLASAAAVVALIAVMSVYYVDNIKTERDIAHNESQKAQKVSQFMTNLFNSGNPIATNGHNPTARELLKKGLLEAGKLHDEPDVQSQMYLTIGKAYTGLGMYQNAEQVMDEALRIRVKEYGEKSIEVAEVYESLGNLYKSEMHWKESVENLRKSLDILIQHKVSQTRIADVMANLAASMRDYGKVDSAEFYARRALNIENKYYKTTDERYLRTEEILAYVLRKKGSHQQAYDIYEQILKRVQNEDEPDLSLLSRTADDLAYLEKKDHDYDAAIAHYRQALAAATRLYGRNHLTTLMIMSNLAAALYADGQYAATENMLRQKIHIIKRHFGQNNWHTASGWEMLSKFYLEQKRYSEAEIALRKSVRIYSNSVGPTNSWTAAAEGLWATSLYILHKDKMGESLFQDSFRILKSQKKKMDHPSKTIIVFASNLLDTHGYHKEADAYRSLLYPSSRETGPLARNK